MQHSDGQTLLQVSKLNTVFPSKHVVKDFDLLVKKGEVIGIVGATGSGKSVAVKSVLQLYSPKEAEVTFENSVYIGNKSIEGLRATEIAIVFQEPSIALNPVKKCGEQIQKIIRKHLKLDNDSAMQRALDLLKSVEIREPQRIYHSFPHQVSGGELQRVMIAMGLSCNPKLLILDEPASSLDKLVQYEIITLLKNLQQDRGLAIILISHDIEMVSALADRIIHISDGEVIANQPTSEFFTAPESEISRVLIEQLNAFRSASYQSEPVGEKILQVNGVGKQFDNGQWAFRNVSFTLHKAEMLGIIGESGSGKSSLAKSLAGLISFTEGIQEYKKEVKIAYVFQDAYSAMDPELSIREILYEVIRLEANSSSTPEQILQQVSLEPEILERKIQQVSGGQRQRINLARALATNPQILICDEVTSGLDLSVQIEIIELLNTKLSELAIIFISHDISLVKFMCQNLLVMKEGKVEKQGKTKELFENMDPGYTFDLINSVTKVKYFINR